MQRISITTALLFVLATAAGAESSLTLSVGERHPVLDFQLLNAPDGPAINRWDQLSGQVVVLDFWATWCAPCVAAFPHLNSLVQQFADRPVRFFSVTYESAQQIGPLLSEHELATEVGLDSDFTTFKSCKAWGIPMVYLFDREGSVAAVIHADHLTAELIESVLRGEVPEVDQHPGWPDPEGAEEYFRSLREG